MSSETTPSLSMAVPAMEAMVRAWDDLEIRMPHLSVMISAGRLKIQQYLSVMRNHRAYIIAMGMSMARPIYETLFSSDYLENSQPVEASPSDELRLYLQARRESIRNINLLSWWQTNRERYPLLFKMAMDYLPIMASSVPCERVFSASAQTDTARRSRISPALLGALQVLKFALKKARLDFSVQYINHVEELEITQTQSDLDEHTLTEMGYDVDESYLASLFV
ncbi:hypothetical protein BOTBODRAFT_625370 [Botryobasidium botryosum FD-172 SS1]|uniref:HAT C-terminal dimerisation domain-containing protein n=1 Tax=Botryobasidium botryosum (strain FD-172 SS1) TaxID=930990 RepID=A0A067MI03_BOTB1|nr:hypothetical protein BOTBODRAFT_625370 [Botryobasidium botryosum FD-172 SS1]